MNRTILENRQTVINAIDIYLKENSTVITKEDLFKFVKLLVAQFMIRTEQGDCYCIDMLEDIHNMERL